MKLAPLLLLLLTFAFAGCNTPNTRRDQYSPKKGDGYWTKQYEHRHDRPKRNAAKPGPESGIFGISHPPYTEVQ